MESYAKPTEKLHGFDFYKSIGSPKYICAPMVDQSELAFRILCRKYGTDLCYTPMLHSRLMTEDKKYKAKHFSTNAEDQPLFVQLCGNDPEIVLSAAQLVQKECNAVDINLGCPQGIARKGNYGSFLLSQPEVICSIVKKLHANLDIPVTCKIRCLPNEKDTMDLVHKIVDSGCSILTVHGRTKEQNKELVGRCNWETIKLIKDTVKIPVFANGGIYNYNDVQECLKFTGVDGIMSSESLLENPALFYNNGEIQDLDILAEEYLDLWKIWDNSNTGCLKAHLFKMLHSGLTRHKDLRNDLGRAMQFEDYQSVVYKLKELRKDEDLVSKFGWYERYWGKCYVGDDKDKKSIQTLLAKRENNFYKEQIVIEKKNSIHDDGKAEEILDAKKKLQVE